MTDDARIAGMTHYRLAGSGAAKDILERLETGEPVQLEDPQYASIQPIVDRTIGLLAARYLATRTSQIHRCIGKLMGHPLDKTSIRLNEPGPKAADLHRRNR